MVNSKIYSRIMGIGEVQRQSIISLISQIGITFIGFLSTMYFAHAVGAGILGAYFLLLAYYNIISIVTDAGFGIAAVKRISEGKEQNEYISAFIVVRSLFVVAAVAALIAFRSFFVDLNNSGAFVWLLLILVVSILYGTVSNGIAGCGKMGIHATGIFIEYVSRFIIQVIGVFFGFSIAGLAGGFVAGILAAAIVEWRFFDLRFVHFGWRHIRGLSTVSLWLFLASGGAMLYSYSDTLMIGYYLGNADVGVYRVAFQFAGIAIVITTAIQSALFPKVSRWGKTGDVAFIEVSLSQAFSYSMLFAVPVAVGGILLGDKLLYFFYGAEFARGFMTLVILLMVQIVTVFLNFLSMYLVALDRQKYAFKVTTLAAFANIMLNAMLIPAIGIFGAAIATLVTMILNAFLTKRELSHAITVRLEKNSTLNILKASFCMAIFVMAYRLLVPLSNVWLTLVPVILGGAIYGILMLKFDGNIYNELKAITTQLNLPWPYWL